jgi:hypothetical protein
LYTTWIAILLGWVPGALLKRYAHGANALMFSGAAGVLWIGLLTLILG